MVSSTIPRGLNQELWRHQKEAISFALQYLREPAKAPMGLIRMPTGTGKTGVIAVLSVGLPPPAWTLILTPWKNLCDQMVEDIEEGFWRVWKPTPKPEIERLYPSTLNDVIARKEPRLILVATFATLVTIFKRHRAKYRELAARLSQVFVDEGHYEPAVEWGQAVKQLQKPTVLLTATPYRNDLKLFRVSKDDVHHYTHEAAEADGIIRAVDFRSLGVVEPSDKQLGLWCKAFANFWKGPEKKKLHKEPRAIICCAKMATVERVATLLREQRINALGIHERFIGRKEDWLRQQTPDPKKVPFDVWVHQNKLTEGLDDQRFCVLAVLNRIRNDRKLIQQIGRVLRRGSKRVGRALVLYSDGLPVERSWKNYRDFEKQTDFIEAERYHQILEMVLERQPAMEYFGGRFRRRFRTDSPELPSHVLLRASAVVRRVRSSFTLQEFTDFTSDFLLLEDCILLGPKKEPLEGPGYSRLWVYAVFGNSPLLIEHSQYEIRLGAMAAVKHGELLFVVDTEGVYPTKYLTEHTRKVSPDQLGRIFSQKIVPKEVSLTNPWPAGPTVRRSTIYADDLASTPAQLTDAVFVCAGVRATVQPERFGLRPRRQYVGFQRGRISEQIRSTERAAFSLTEFVEWTRELAKLIQTEKRESPEFFRRYLSPVAPPGLVVPKFLILNLFEGDVELQDELGEVVELRESILEVKGRTPMHNATFYFPFTLRYRRNGKGKEASVSATLSYNPDSARFRIHSDELNSKILVSDPDTGETEGFLTYFNNNDEAFTVALEEPDIYYTAQAFYRIDYTHAETRLAGLLTPIDALGKVASEKGAKAKHKTRWDTSSVFGLIDNVGATGMIPREFGKAELLLCDDLGKEVADFICVNFTNHKIAFIHAKHGKGRNVSASALHDVVAQALKNLGVLSRAGSNPAHLDRWNRNAVWPGTNIHRWRYGSKSLPTENALWARIRSEILEHPNGKREVWLVVGQTLEKKALMEQLHDPNKRDPVTGQVVHLLSSLHATCSQINVSLRVFCH